MYFSSQRFIKTPYKVIKSQEKFKKMHFPAIFRLKANSKGTESLGETVVDNSVWIKACLTKSFTLPFCECRFISTMFIAPRVNLIIEAFKGTQFRFSQYNSVTFSSIFKVLCEEPNESLMIFINKIKKFTVTWQNGNMLKKVIHILFIIFIKVKYFRTYWINE